MSKSIVIISMVLCVIPHESLLIGGRLICGIGVALGATISNALLFEIAIPSHRTRVLNSITLFAGISQLFVFVYLFFDEGGAIYWRSVYFVYIGIGVLDLLIEVIFAWDIDSVIYRIKTKGRDSAIKMVTRYLDTQSAIETVEEFEAVISTDFNA